MKFYFRNFKFLIIFIFIISLSCPTDMIKYTVWKGTYTTEYGNDKKMELIFDSTSKVTVIFEAEDNNFYFLNVRTDYTLTENYTFKTGKFESDAYLNGGGTSAVDHLILSLDGTLDYFKNFGEGDYTAVKIFDNGTWVKIKNKWKVRKLVE